MEPPAATTDRRPIRWGAWAAVAVTAVAAAVRWPRMADGLWLDEMTTLVGYVLQPWHKVVAGGPGQYLPNNHVLHTVLAKLVHVAVFGGGEAVATAGVPPSEVVLRLPAWAAGSLLPVALAWPLRRRAPATAGLVAVAAALHPWLVALSTDARGYTLMLLLGVVATHLLPRERSGRQAAAYATALAAAIYAVPLAVLLVPAHAAAALATGGRPRVRRWWPAATGGLLLAGLLYAPMAGGLATYYAHPFGATASYGQFVDAVPRYALTGDRLPPRPFDPDGPAAAAVPDPPGGRAYWAVPVSLAIAGSVVGWRRTPDARPMFATLAAATAGGLLLPLVVTTATEVRFDTWAAPWVCLSAAASASAVAAAGRVGRVVAAVAVVALLGQFARWDVGLRPNQPVRDAVALAGRLAPTGRPIVVAYLGATESVFCYGADAPGHVVLPAPDPQTFRATVEGTRVRTGHRPWVVILFEEIARDRDADTAAADAYGYWSLLRSLYRPVARLPGRLTPVAVYAPIDDAPPRVGVW